MQAANRDSIFGVKVLPPQREDSRKFARFFIVCLKIFSAVLLPRLRKRNNNSGNPSRTTRRLVCLYGEQKPINGYGKQCDIWGFMQVKLKNNRDPTSNVK